MIDVIGYTDCLSNDAWTERAMLAGLDELDVTLLALLERNPR